MAYLITDFGAATNKPDNARAINDAIAFAFMNGGGEVIVPPGTYAVRDTILMEHGVTLRGASRGFSWEKNAPVSVLQIRHGAGPGSSESYIVAAVNVVSNSHLIDLGFSYPDQNPQNPIATEWAPTICWDVREIRAKTNVTIEGCHFDRAYIAADLRGAGIGNTLGCAYLRFKGNTGSPLKHALRMNFAVDWCEIADNYFNAGGYLPGAATLPPLLAFTLANGILYDIGNTDWLQFESCKHWGYGCAWNFDMTGDYYPSNGPFLIHGCQTDACPAGINLQGIVGDLQIIGNSFTSFNPMTRAPGWTLGIGAKSGWASIQFHENLIFGPHAGVMWLGQPDQIAGPVALVGNVGRSESGGVQAVVFPGRVEAAANTWHGYRFGSNA